MSKLRELRERLGVSEEDMRAIITTYAAAYATGDAEADLIPVVLNKYEDEMQRQQDVISRLQTKIRNYRSGIKQLQRAHEASLHREKALQDKVSKRLDELETGRQYDLVSFRFDTSVPADAGY